MPSSGSDRTRHLFAEPPTDAQLSALLPAPRADRLSLSSAGDLLEVAIVPRSIWFLLPGLVWFGVVVAVVPWTAPLWGAAFMGWARWLGLVLLTWVVILPVALVLVSWLLQRPSAGDVVLIFDPMTGKMYLPTNGRTIGAEQLCHVAEVVRWAEDAGRWKPVVQTSLVLVTSDGLFEVIAVVTEVRPGLFAMPLADRLADVFGVSVVRVQLGAEESREM